MKAMVNAGGCSNDETVEGCFYCHCLCSCSEVLVALAFLFDAQLFHPHDRETQHPSSSFSEV